MGRHYVHTNHVKEGEEDMQKSFKLVKHYTFWKDTIVSRDMDKMVRGQKVTQNTFDKMGRRLPDALGD